MNNNIFYSADYQSKDFIGLFDRIINIKFTRKNGEQFTLRSDYEPMWSGGKLYFKTCQPKPDIRVTYTQYQATMINVDIYITNLNILESETAPVAAPGQKVAARVGTNQPNESLTSKSDKRIVKAEIEMGYKGQFFNWANYKGNITSDKQNYESFLNLQRPNDSAILSDLVASQTFFREDLRKCTVMIEWAANTTNPPDRITQFHGFVGSTEAGLQPFSLGAFSYSTGDVGEKAQISKKDILNGLEDTHTPVGSVQVSTLRTEKAPFDLVLSSFNTAYRNFFNGGRGFTLLEGYCFHLFSRRFIRSDIEVKTNELLSQANLEYLQGFEYSGGENPLIEIEKKITDMVYRRERVHNKEYFTAAPEGENLAEEVIQMTPAMPRRVKNRIEEEINAIMVRSYVGSRYTIKNLPEYRKLYSAIRKTLLVAAQKGEYKLWWEAAEELSNSALDGTPVNTAKEIASTLTGARYYVRDLETGNLASNDCYLQSILSVLSKDWIIPTQSIAAGEPLRDSSHKMLTFKAPEAVNAGGFSAPGGDQPIKCFSGLLEVRDAYMFGVPVLCSLKASKLFHEKYASSSAVDIEFMTTAQGQIENISQTFGLQYYKLHNGGYYLYDPAENARDTAGQDFVVSQANTPFRIPAIYDITLDPIRKIRMPFAAFLNPMTTVEWNSRSTLGSMISFYYQPEKGRNFFMVIKNSVDFGTVGDHNMMEIDLVDTQYVDKTEIPRSVLAQEDKNIFVETLIIPDGNTDTWRKIYESPVGRIPANLRDLWKHDPEVPEKNLSAEGRVSAEKFFLLLEAWNPSLFFLSSEAEDGWSWDDSKKRIDKDANKRYGKLRPEKKHFPEIAYCLPLLANSAQERIYMKFPFMPDEASYAAMKEADDKYIMVYESGVWEMRLKVEVQKTYQIGAV